VVVAVQRVYEPPGAGDGERFLVERLWPRGVTRDAAHPNGWLRDRAPSPELRRWFGHDPERRDEFRRRYESELRSADRQALLAELAAKAQQGRITSVYAAMDTEHNGTLVLRDVIERGIRSPGRTRITAGRSR
jgi:uncharacterized protein YeaO (DUF488 family)